MSLVELQNIGPKSERMLAKVGIVTTVQLRKLGAVAAFLLVREAGLKPSLNFLWALHGALTATKWNRLTEETKRRLLDSLNTAERCAAEGP